MIKLERTRQAGAVAKTFRGQDRIDRLLVLLDRRRSGEGFNAGFWKGKEHWKKAKDQLKKESGGKCAYCEASTTKVAHGDVEHFRPKATYWWLAYCYENYLYSCQICNQVFKGDRFPTSGPMLAEPLLPPAGLSPEDLQRAVALFTPDPLTDGEGVSIAGFRQALLAEQAHLPDPYLLDPEPFFRWTADPVQKEVAIAPRDGSHEAARVFAAVRDLFGLNREELKRSRWVLYQQLDYLRQSLPALPPDLREKGVDLIRGMMAGDAEFAGMVRYFVLDEWGLDLS
jgi:hypothetical protein